MRVTIKILFALLVMLSGIATARAEPFRFESGTVDIPPGFAGPVEQRKDDWLVVYGFLRNHPGRQTGTLLQITVFRPPDGPPEPRELEKYLLELLAGVARRRTEFVRGPVQSIDVSRTPVAKVTWRGRGEGIPMNGVMYCYIDGPRVISFHTQDFDAAGREAMAAAIRAFESASIGGR